MTRINKRKNVFYIYGATWVVWANRAFHISYFLLFLFTALHGMQTRCSDENSDCLSVCLSNACIVAKRKKNLRKNGWWGRPLLPEILGQPATVGEKTPILNRYSLIAPYGTHIYVTYKKFIYFGIYVGHLIYAEIYGSPYISHIYDNI